MLDFCPPGCVGQRCGEVWSLTDAALLAKAPYCNEVTPTEQPPCQYSTFHFRGVSKWGWNKLYREKHSFASISWNCSSSTCQRSNALRGDMWWERMCCFLFLGAHFFGGHYTTPGPGCGQRHSSLFCLFPGLSSIAVFLSSSLILPQK